MTPVKSIRLSFPCRNILMQMSNEGGWVESIPVDYRPLLLHLGLIAKRPRFVTEREKRVQSRLIAQVRRKLARAAISGTKASSRYDRSEETLHGLVERIADLERQLNAEVWCLTDAAKSLLFEGRVLVNTAVPVAVAPVKTAAA